MLGNGWLSDIAVGETAWFGVNSLRLCYLIRTVEDTHGMVCCTAIISCPDNLHYVSQLLPYRSQNQVRP